MREKVKQTKVHINNISERGKDEGQTIVHARRTCSANIFLIVIRRLRNSLFL